MKTRVVVAVNIKPPQKRIGHAPGPPPTSESSGVSRLAPPVTVALGLLLLAAATASFAEWHDQSSSATPTERSLASPFEAPGKGRPSIGAPFLTANEAFSMTLGAVTAESITVHWSIADGYYLYRDKFRFAMTWAADRHVPVDARLPDGELKDDPIFGRVEVFYRHVRGVLPWNWSATSNSSVALTVAYQGCADQGLCYPPVTSVLSIDRLGIER